MRVRVLRLVATAIALPLLLGGLVTGCFPGSGKNQKDVAPPPLVQPTGAVETRLLEPILVTEVEKQPLPTVQMLLCTPDTGLGKPLYANAQCVLRRETAERLQHAEAAAQALKPKRSLRVLDGARTREAQAALFAQLGGDPRFLDRPSREGGTPDTRGAGVDVTLVWLEGEKAGQECPMGSRYMEPSETALRGATLADAEMLANRTVLTEIMTKQGFVAGACWWDFSDPDWKRFPEIQASDYQHALAPGMAEAAAAELEAESGAERLAESGPVEGTR